MRLKGGINIPRTHFLKSLAVANGLGRVVFVSHEAMLFGTRKSWWGNRRPRPLPHEGVDICRYRTLKGESRALGPGSRVPVVYPGRVWAISHDDFIDRSIFVRHEGDSGVFFTVYAHVTPLPGVAEGDLIAGGEVFATLADPSHRGLIIACHLHLSLMTFSDELPKEKLRWDAMSTGTDISLYDPISLLGEVPPLCEEVAGISSPWRIVSP